MTSSPEAREARAARESLLLRGASAADAVPYQRAGGQLPWGRRRSDRPATPPPAPPSPTPDAASAVTAAVHAAAGRTGVPSPAAEPRPAARPWVLPESANDDVTPSTRTGVRLGEVYAEQLARLREEARREGWAAGHAEGLVAAEQVVAAAERAAEERLAAVQARWERRLASATAAMAAAAERLDATAAPVLDELRDGVLDAVTTLVGDVLGRELAMTTTGGLDALRRALTLSPTDVPIVVRLHPDDLAEVPPGALAQLPATVTVLGDPGVERAGAVAEAGTTRVDAQLSSALERVLAVLRS